MGERLEIDCTTGQAKVVALTPTEQADVDARTAAGPALEATRQTVLANAATLQQRAQGALARNAAYLGLVTPTLVDQAAQVTLLTRECSALIRLLLNALDSTAGA